MKTKDVAKQYGIEQIAFERFLERKSYNRTNGIMGMSIADSDVEEAVRVFNEEKEKDAEWRRKGQEQLEELNRREQERKLEEERNAKHAKGIIVTTGDLKRDYEVLGPVYFQVSNKGLFGSALSALKEKYLTEIQAMRMKGTMSEKRADWGFLYGEWSVGQNDFEAAFFIATEELKKRAAMVGADAVICMRQDIDMDTNGFAFFYLQMYGTAVKFTD